MVRLLKADAALFFHSAFFVLVSTDCESISCCEKLRFVFDTIEKENKRKKDSF